MKLKVFLLVCFAWVCAYMPLYAALGFSKAAFYAAMASGDMDKITHELGLVREAGVNEQQGYIGALLMRQAGLMAKPKDRLKYFKEGRMQFDPAITGDPSNTEYHFLRLTIQEHTPNVVKYKSDIVQDKEFVIKHYKTQSAVVQQAILEYAKNSQVLHREDFNFGR
jgi:hypothetical protein